MALRLDRSLQGIEGAVEADREPTQLFRAFLFEPSRPVERVGDLLGLLGEALDRGKSGPGDPCAQEAGEQHAATDEQAKSHRKLVHVRIDFGQGKRDLDRIVNTST